jgi:hypothetical protein
MVLAKCSLFGLFQGIKKEITNHPVHSCSCCVFFKKTWFFYEYMTLVISGYKNKKDALTNVRASCGMALPVAIIMLQIAEDIF